MLQVYGVDNKKMLNILILEILRKYSDENHRLTQQEIMRKLKAEYGVEKIDRRTVRDNVQSLVDMGYGIENEGTEGYYMYEREFEDEELRFLIDAVLFSKSVSDTIAKRLIEKLKDMGNIYFDAKVSHVKPTPTLNRTENKSILYNVGSINEAMDQKKKISFRYNKYGADFKMHDQGKKYVMNPYQMIASNGRYYLLGNIDWFDDVTYYRIDKMTDVEILEDMIKPQKEVKGIGGKLDLPKHMAEHIYMFSGESISATIKTQESMMDTLIDWFGKDFRVSKENNDEIIVTVKCNKQALFYWSLQYGPYVEVLTPIDFRKEIASAVKVMMEKYN